MQMLRDYMQAYTSSAAFGSLASEAAAVIEGLNSVTYTMRIKGSRVTVARYDCEPDYSGEVEATFERFRQGAVESHLLNVPDSGSMDHVEARIALLVARLYPREFAALDEFCGRHAGFFDDRLARFEREVQFYLAYIDHAERVALAGASFCYPAVSVDSKEISADDAVDLALAAKLAQESRRVVRNDFFLRASERIVVVTGPNQGGKTTFSRTFAQLHYLAALGVPVPARSASVFLPDEIFTHFEREEDISTLRGKLDDELVRVRAILDRATTDSLVVLNEMFSATTARDALALGTAVLRKLIDLGCLAVCVTFIDELASLGPEAVSMVAGVDPEDPSQRTFEIARRPADGRAYALAIADKYGLSYDHVTRRLR
jgi:DNA mismatch repair ATPase MutS